MKAPRHDRHPEITRRTLRIIALLCMTAALGGCENAWMIFPKYPAPYSYQHPKMVEGTETEINHVTAGVYLGQIRGTTDYESPTEISVRVLCRPAATQSASGTIRLEGVRIEVDGEKRYARRFETVAVAFGGGEKTAEGVFCSGKDGEIRFNLVGLSPEVTYEKGQTLTVSADIAVTRQGVTRRGKLSSRYVGSTKSGLMRQAYVP